MGGVIDATDGQVQHVIDMLDRAIIKQLQEDGRRPVAEIARRLNVSDTTVQRRVERLIADGVISIIALIQASLVGLPVHVIFGVTAQLDQVANIEEALAAEDEVIWVAWTTGAFDLVAEAFFESNQHLRQFVQTRLACIPGIIRVENTTVLSLTKNVHKLANVERVERARRQTPAAAVTPAGVPGTSD